MKEINKRIRHYRRIRNFSQTDIAERLGLKCSTYSQMERKGDITCERLIRLSEILRVDATTLLYGEGDYPQYNEKSKPEPEPEPLPPKPNPEPNKYTIYDLSKKEHDHIVCLRNISVKNSNFVMQMALKILKKEIKPSI